MDELQNPNNGGSQQNPKPELDEDDPNYNNNGERFINEDFDSNCSTPYVSAPSSPGRNPNNGYFFSCPASPMHYVLSSSSISSSCSSKSKSKSDFSGSSFEFEFSARFSTNSSVASGSSMISADELFLNGQIRPMKLSSHLQRPQILAPLLDVEDEEERGFDLGKGEDLVIRGRDLRLRNRSLHRRARSSSPLRNSPFQWHEEEEIQREISGNDSKKESESNTPSTETTPSVSASSSRSSSSGRSSKRWEFLKDFLRSKSEGRGNGKEKFWHSMSFVPVTKEKKSQSSSSSVSGSKEKKLFQSSSEAQKPKRSTSNQQAATAGVPAKKSVTGGKPLNGVGKRRIPLSAHELHYTKNRAQAEEMKKKTFLPYRQGLLGCLGFSSKSYGAMNGFARALNSVSSR